jgi:hypothetical protein
LASFTDTAVLRDAAQHQMQRVSITERGSAGETLDSAPVRVTIQGEGWSDHITVDWAPGSLADPMTREQLSHKWSDCLRHAGLALTLEQGLGLLDASLDIPAAELLMPLREVMLSA